MPVLYIKAVPLPCQLIYPKDTASVEPFRLSRKYEQDMSVCRNINMFMSACVFLYMCTCVYMWF